MHCVDSMLYGEAVLCTERWFLKVARVLLIALTSNLECVFRIESQQVQGHFKVNGVFFGGWASNLGLVIAMECQTSSRSSQGHWGIYY